MWTLTEGKVRENLEGAVEASTIRLCCMNYCMSMLYGLFSTREK